MISESIYLEWRNHPATQELLGLCRIGKEQVTDDMLLARGAIADFERGAAFAYSEVEHIIRTGENIKE